MSTVLLPGDKAPDFQLAADGKTTIRLADFAGRKLVIFFYPKDDTKGCTQEAKDFSALRDQFIAAGTNIVGISADPVSSHDKFKAKHDLKVVLGSDTTHEILGKYGVWVQKSMYGRVYMGIERTTFLLDSHGRIAKIWRNVKVSGHAAETLAAAQAL